MAQDRPSAAELVAAVREFLEHDVLAVSTGRVRFHTRVAINALGMVERELTEAGSYTEAERKRAADLLGHDATAPELERELAAAIRTGAIDDRLDQVRAHLRATVREKLLVANPSYLPSAYLPSAYLPSA